LKLALFIGSHSKDTWQVRLGWFLTRLVQKGNYSNVTHVEAILDEHEDGTVTIASATLRKETPTGKTGVRIKRTKLVPENWIIVDKPEWDVAKAWAWFLDHEGQPYDTRGAFVCWLPFWWSNKRQWFCNQAVGASIGLDSAEIFTPSQFSSIVTSP
jgi:hypothetical protein